MKPVVQITLFFIFIFSAPVIAQEWTVTDRLPGSDTSVAREFKNGKLSWETFEVNGRTVKTRMYFYTDTNFFYHEWTDKFNDYVAHEFYLDSTPKAIVSFHRSKLNGPYLTFYQNGSAEYVAEFKMDKQQGVEYHYYENGALCCTISYVNDVVQGPYREWYPDSSLKEYGYVVNGNVEDTCRTFYPNGQLCAVVIYKAGIPWEVVSGFDAGGNARPMGTLKNGTGTILNYDENGVLEDADVYENGEYVESYWEWDLPDDGRPE